MSDQVEQARRCLAVEDTAPIRDSGIVEITVEYISNTPQEPEEELGSLK
jgi:hypothetical protein